MFEFTTLFCTIDDFFQKNEAIYWQYLKQENPKVRQRSGVLCLSEIIDSGYITRSKLYATFFNL